MSILSRIDPQAGQPFRASSMTTMTRSTCGRICLLVALPSVGGDQEASRKALGVSVGPKGGRPVLVKVGDQRDPRLRATRRPSGDHRQVVHMENLDSSSQEIAQRPSKRIQR